jgi:fermentation-respiration switch protein FrsA (DUF1100 family)
VDKDFIFFPEREISSTPDQVGLPFQDIYLTTKDQVRINGWWVPYPNAKVTLLWLHGNGGNLSDRVSHIKRFHDHLKVSIFIIDYREYGKSEGEVSEEGTYLDAQAAYDYLVARPDTGKIIVYGHSLGAGVATEMVLRRNAHALMLESPFLSVREMAKVQYGALPLGGLITTLYDSRSKMKKVKIPILILHGDADETVPYAHGRQLFSEAHEPKQFYTIRNAGHNEVDLVGGEAYYQVVSDFIRFLEVPATP